MLGGLSDITVIVVIITGILGANCPYYYEVWWY